MKAYKNSLSTVYHVGTLDVNKLGHNKPEVYDSLEGSGLSVSQHPEEWTEIAKLGGSDVYSLTKANPNFLIENEENKEKAIQWCVDNEFLVRKKKYRAYTSNEDGEDCYFELDTKKQAENESDDVRDVDGYSFGLKGQKYWKSCFSSSPNNSLAEAFAVIFYAETLGYDGVWWHEVLDISSLSAPRGVIFQHKLCEWEVKLVK